MDWKQSRLQNLVRAFLAPKSPAEMQAFLRDLLTEGELFDLAKRLDTARMLTMNVPYPKIQEATGFSTTTIARVSRWLKNGMGGYTLVLSRLHPHTLRSHGRGVH